jgi:membrane protein
MRPKQIFELVKQTGIEWYNDKSPRLGAALAYYSIFSIAPLLILSIAIATRIFGEQAAQGQVVEEIKGTIGDGAAQAVQDMLVHASRPGSGWGIATVLGIVTLLFGASGVFGELQDALNTIWKVTPKSGRGLLGVVKDRFLSFTMVLGTAFLLLVSLILSAALEAISKYMPQMCSATGLCLGHVLNALVSFVVVTALFAMIFKVLPDVELGWRDVAIAAVITSLLFSLGKFLIGLYLGRASVASAYGAAGSLVVMLIWVYYSAQILLFGAEFSRVYTRNQGRQIRPSANAVAMNWEDRVHQGLEANNPTEQPAPSSRAEQPELAAHR